MKERYGEGQIINYNIMYNYDFSMVEVNGKPYEVIPSPEKLGDSFLVREAMKPVLKGIGENKYASILRDGESPIEVGMFTTKEVIPLTSAILDTRSKIINYKLFLQELGDCINNLPTELQMGIKKDALASLISHTYLIKPENMEEFQDDINFIISIENDIMLNGENITMSNAERLYNITKRLNQANRSYIEQSDSFIFFNKKDKEEWQQRLEGKKQREKQKRFIQNVNAFVSVDSMECILEPLEVRSAKAHYTTLDGLIYDAGDHPNYETAATSKVDYEVFCDKLKNTLSTIGEDERERFIKKVIEDSVKVWYGHGAGYKLAKIRNDKRASMSNELIKILTNRIINDNSMIDIERVREIEKSFIELSSEEERICQEKLDEEAYPSNFEDEIVKRTYENIILLHKLGVPNEAIQTLKGQSNAALKEERTKRTMKVFGRLALSGENTPTYSDVYHATEFLNIYNDIDRG